MDQEILSSKRLDFDENKYRLQCILLVLMLSNETLKHYKKQHLVRQAEEMSK
jgi:hypothetical protein